MMHQIFGHLAFLWATILAVPISLVVTAVLFAVWRWSPIQRVCMPGADESRDAEHLFRALKLMFDQDGQLQPHHFDLAGRIGHGILIRNGLNAIALALVFFVVMTGAHSLLMAL